MFNMTDEELHALSISFIVVVSLIVAESLSIS